jgi:hypothetical protein
MHNRTGNGHDARAALHAHPTYIHILYVNLRTDLREGKESKTGLHYKPVVFLTPF